MKTIKIISAVAMAAILGGLFTPSPAGAKSVKLAVIVKADGSLTGLGLKEFSPFTQARNCMRAP